MRKTRSARLATNLHEPPAQPRTPDDASRLSI